MATAVDDPIRAEVERVLNLIVDLTVKMPVRLATAVPRCVVRRAARIGPLAEPTRVVRSLVDLLAAGGGPRRVVTPDDASSADAPAITAPWAPDRARAAPVRDRTTDGGLPIEDYLSLAASQVVDRLPTLTPDELLAVRDFEDAHRGRRTILGRIEQLLA